MSNEPQLVYTGRVTNWPLLALVVIVTLPLIGMGILSDDEAARSALVTILVLLVILAVVVTTSSVRTSIGRNGVIIRFGLLGLPRFDYPIADVRGAEAIDISFWSAGGWGIHWSPWRGLRLTLRSGPALRLVLTNGRKVTVSVTDPQAAIAALNASSATSTA